MKCVKCGAEIDLLKCSSCGFDMEKQSFCTSYPIDSKVTEAWGKHISYVNGLWASLEKRKSEFLIIREYYSHLKSIECKSLLGKGYDKEINEILFHAEEIDNEVTSNTPGTLNELVSQNDFFEKKNQYYKLLLEEDKEQISQITKGLQGTWKKNRDDFQDIIDQYYKIAKELKEITENHPEKIQDIQDLARHGKEVTSLKCKPDPKNLKELIEQSDYYAKQVQKYKPILEEHKELIDRLKEPNPLPSHPDSPAKGIKGIPILWFLGVLYVSFIPLIIFGGMPKYVTQWQYVVFGICSLLCAICVELFLYFNKNEIYKNEKKGFWLHTWWIYLFPYIISLIPLLAGKVFLQKGFYTYNSPLGGMVFVPVSLSFLALSVLGAIWLISGFFELNRKRVIWIVSMFLIGVVFISLLLFKIKSNTYYKTGDTIYLGSYEQSLNTPNEPIEWKIVNINGNTALLVSEEYLDVMQYNNQGEAVEWTESDIENYLNNEFLSTAFSEELSDLIIPSSQNGIQEMVSIPNLAYYDGRYARKKEGYTINLTEWALDKYLNAYKDNKSLFPSSWVSNESGETSALDSSQACLWAWIEPDSSEDEIRLVSIFKEDEYLMREGNPEYYAGIRPMIFIDLEAYDEYMTSLKENTSATNQVEVSSQETIQENSNADEKMAFYDGLENGLYKQVLMDRKKVFCLNQDGTITVYGADDSNSSNEYSDWTNIKKIVFIGRNNELAGLKEDGRVITLTEEKDWTGVSDIYSSDGFLFGIDKNGYVIGQTDIRKEIVIEQMDFSYLFLNSDGTLSGDDLTIWYHGDWNDDYKKWSNLKDIGFSDSRRLFGLTNDGKVLYGGLVGMMEEASDEETLNSWSEVSEMSVGRVHILALKPDGTVLSTGNNDYGQCDVSDWKDIVRIEAIGNTSFGYTSSGKIYMAGFDCLSAE